MLQFIKSNRQNIIEITGLVVLGAIAISLVILVAYYGNGEFAPHFSINNY